MSTATKARPHRNSEGTASAERLHEAWRKGAIRAAQINRSMTSDPLLLDSGIPTLTQRQAARHQRSAPHLHLVHRIDTATDIPEGMTGGAFGDAMVPEGFGPSEVERIDVYQAEPIVPVDRKLRAHVWRALIGAYVVGVAVLAYLWS